MKWLGRILLWWDQGAPLRPAKQRALLQKTAASYYRAGHTKHRSRGFSK